MSAAAGTVLLVDDDAALVQGLARTLWEQPYRVLSASSARDALDLLAREQVDVVVSDHQMPRMTGVELLAQAARQFPSTARVLLTGHATLVIALRAVNEGQAFRVLLKPCPPEQFLSALNDALKQSALSAAATRGLQATRAQTRHESQYGTDRTPQTPSGPATASSPSGELDATELGFSPREIEVLHLLARGHRVAQIARALFLSQHTVRNHLKAMFRKAGVHSQGELVSQAWRGQ